MAIFHKTLQHHEDTTEKRDISQEDIEFLKKLQLEMNTQDTTGTADPRFWVPKVFMIITLNKFMGFSPVEIAKRLGHGKVTTTIETYCHQSMDAQEKIADRLGKVERGEESGL